MRPKSRKPEPTAKATRNVAKRRGDIAGHLGMAEMAALLGEAAMSPHWQEIKHHDGSVRRWERLCGLYDVVPDIAQRRFLCRSYNRDGTWAIFDNKATAAAARERCDSCVCKVCDGAGKRMTHPAGSQEPCFACQTVKP